MIVALVRHGRTEWNDQGRMQGRVDVPLSESGRAQVQGWRLPGVLASAVWVTSPLARAVETAALLGARHAEVEGYLTEMNWGEWEGCTLAELQERYGSAFTDNAARGLDFRPPGGESPRDVQRRVGGWLARIARHPGPVAAVTHRGVIRALLATATGWDMIGKAPVRLADNSLHVFRVAPDGSVRPLAWNVPLAPH